MKKNLKRLRENIRNESSNLEVINELCDHDFDLKNLFSDKNVVKTILDDVKIK